MARHLTYSLVAWARRVQAYSPMIELRTLGTLNIEGSGGNSLATIQGRSRRLALLVYLAAARPAGPQRRGALLTLFWPEAEAAHAHAALRQSVRVLRNALGERAIRGLGRDALVCDSELLWCDAAAFDAACDAGRHMEALRLFAGEFLAGFSIPGAPEFDTWMMSMRARLQARAAAAATTLAEEADAAGELAPASEWAARTLEFDPDNEAAMVRLALMLDRQGERARALDVHDAFTAHLRRDFGVGPSPETQRLGRALRASGRPKAGALWTHSSAEHPPGSIAVLPFLNLGDDADFEYFCDGMTEELIADLSSFKGLSVAARTSSFAFKGRNDDVRRIGSRLGVSHLVEGSIRRTGERVRVTAQLIDVESGFHRWADTFEMPLADAVNLPGEVFRRIAPALEREVASRSRRPSRGTSDRDAYLLFLRGQFHLYKRSPADLEKARALFEEAVERDPLYAAAHGGLANALVALPVYCGVSTGDCLPRALETAALALALDPDLASAHSARSLGLAMYAWDWKGSEESALRALENEPQDVVLRSLYAFYVLAHAGRFEAALAEAAKARDADPLSLPANAYVAYIAYLARRHDLAEATCRATLELNGTFPLALWVLEMTLEELGRTSEAVRLARSLAEATQGSPMFTAHLARALARAGATSEAQTLSASVEAELPPKSPVWYWLAGVHGALGEVDKGLAALERAVKARSNFLVFAAVHPTLDPLRGSTRFQAILRTLGMLASDPEAPVTLR